MRSKVWTLIVVCVLSISSLSSCATKKVAVHGIRTSQNDVDVEPALLPPGSTFQEKQAALEAEMNAKVKVVLAARDIRKGTVWRKDQLVEKEVAASTVPDRAIEHASAAIGRKVRYGVDKGQVVCEQDIVSSPTNNFSIIPINIANNLPYDYLSRGKTYQEKQAELDRHSKSRTPLKVVVVVKTVEEGARFTIDTLEEREVEERKVPHDALSSAYSVIGRQSRYGMSPGDIVGKYDIEEGL